MQEPEMTRNAAPLPIAPGLNDVRIAEQVPQPRPVVDRRVVYLCGLAVGLGAAMFCMSRILLWLISFFTNLSYFGRLSLAPASPAQNQLGVWAIGLPVLGGIVVGFLARYGSKAIRGHGIPEAMEQVLTNRSRIPPRITFLKPFSAAIAIGTGGPFGAEGPIIATGGALGSLVGQLLHTSAVERKALLAAGAAAGMSATFGSPVSAVLLAIELLLFEYRPRSVIPVALASAMAAGLRLAVEGHAPVFAMPAVQEASVSALATYVLLGIAIGVCATGITRMVYAVEDAFERLPIHWMWWPALGGLVVGVTGYFFPRVLGVGYENIEGALSGNLVWQTALTLGCAKLFAWSLSLGSGTSGGTLAPLLTIGGCLGAAAGSLTTALAPQCGIDVRVAALVGMAAMFAGAARALLASAVFAFEVTMQPFTLLPLLTGCSAAYLAACLLSRQSIMTERILRRGISAPSEYSADLLGQVTVAAAASREVVTLRIGQTVAEIRDWLANGSPQTQHQGFPIVDEQDRLAGVVTRRDLDKANASDRVGDIVTRPVRYVYDTTTLREAAEHLASHGIGRLPVVSKRTPGKVVGILTRSDILAAFRFAVDEYSVEPPSVQLQWPALRLRSRRS